MKIIYTCLFSLLFLALGAQTTQTFNYTGAMQTFVVPANVTSITVDVVGGQGADNGTALGGRGGRVQGVLAVNPGDQLNIFVGRAGINSLNQPADAFDGGGGVYSYSTCGLAGTGGGGTDIRLNGITLNDRAVSAGGGGGAGGATNPVQYCAGGNGGGLIALDGTPWNTWPQSMGGGGTQTAGGAAGVACCGCPQYTTAGALGIGGNGSGDCAGGGGGGGGYYGGGGSCFGGGGGGSSYTGVMVTSVTHTQGFQTGNGYVTLTYDLSTGQSASINQPSVSVSPNPFDNQIFFNVSETSDAEYFIVDISGRWICSGTVSAVRMELATAHFPIGVYFLSVKTSQGVVVKKLLCSR